MLGTDRVPDDALRKSEALDERNDADCQIIRLGHVADTGEDGVCRFEDSRREASPATRSRRHAISPKLLRPDMARTASLPLVSQRL